MGKMVSSTILDIAYGLDIRTRTILTEDYLQIVDEAGKPGSFPVGILPACAPPHSFPSGIP